MTKRTRNANSQGLLKKTKQQQQPKMGKLRPESIKLFKMFQLYYKKRVFL